jgi:DNA repair exonuclease SbcCD nuclease subunit
MNQQTPGGINIFDFSGNHDITSYDSILLAILMEYVVKL